jgi:hypothetical protein
MHNISIVLPSIYDGIFPPVERYMKYGIKPIDAIRATIDLFSLKAV